ncbi:fused MFS/spermidine synthase [Candidatus Riflebacteria bacterium]
MTERKTDTAYRVYYFTVFFTGMGIMAIEMSAVRLMAPVFGTSMFVWTNVIATIIAALTIGYSFGGTLADRYPDKAPFYAAIAFAGLLTLNLPFVAPIVMKALVLRMEDASQLLFYSGIASFLLFFPPTLLLGMASPYAIRLCLQNLSEIGNVSGNIFCFSTTGSIVGTFAPPLWTLPILGTKKSFFLVAIILILVALVGSYFAPSGKARVVGKQ